MGRSSHVHDDERGCGESWAEHSIVRRGAEWLWQCPDGRVLGRIPPRPAR